MNVRSLTFSVFLSTLAPAAGAQERTWIRDVHVVDVAEGRVLRDQAVLIEGERIAALGPAASAAAPDGARVVDGGGRYLVPGLFDMHVHFAEEHAEDSLLLFVANGVTTVQSMHGTPWHLELRQRVAAGELLGPRIFTTGPTTAQVGVRDPDHAERTVREQKAAGYDGIKMYGDGSNTMSRETYHRLVTTAHELGLRVVGHAARNLPFAAVIAEDQDSIDHMEEIVYTEESFRALVGPYIDLQFGKTLFADAPELLAGDAPDFREQLAGEVRALAERVEESGLYVTPTLVTFGTIQKLTDDDIFALLEKDELRWIHPTTRAAWMPDRQRFRTGRWKEQLAFMARYLERNVELQESLVSAFHAAGVPLMCGTDAPFDLVVPGCSLHDELEAFVACGMTPLEALRSATLVPARFLGLETESGSIAAGKRADLVLVEGDPLEDAAATRRIAGVCVRGRWLAKVELDERLGALATRNEAAEKRVGEISALLDTDRLKDAIEELGPPADRDPRIARWLEQRVNARGYELLNAKRVDEAVGVFKLNTIAFPEAFNTWDSLGEACLEKGELEEALRHYERSLELNPGNENGRQMIEKIAEKSGKGAAASGEPGG